ncbi:MAG: hypothetical protein QNK63_04220 [Flavobacteriales bacterium]
MKKLLTVSLVLFSLFGFSQENCEKVFVKQKKTRKKNQSKIFETNKIVQTKGVLIYNDNKRLISYSFLERGDSLLLEFQYKWIGENGLGLKKSFELGQEIEIAFIFEDETYDIITFDSPAIYPLKSTSSSDQQYQGNYNYINLTTEYFEKLRTVQIAAYEIKNPFGLKERGLTGTKSQAIKSFEMKEKYRPLILNYAKCFYAKVSE